MSGCGRRAGELDQLTRQIAFKENEERMLRAKLVRLPEQARFRPGVESEWVALTRDYNVPSRGRTEELLKKSEQSRKVAVDLEERQIGEQFRILDPARRAAAANQPRSACRSTESAWRSGC